LLMALAAGRTASQIDVRQAACVEERVDGAVCRGSILGDDPNVVGERREEAHQIGQH